MTQARTVLIPWSIFPPLREDQHHIGYELFGRKNGTSYGPYFAPEVEEIKAGVPVEFHVPIVPGLTLVSAFIEVDSKAMEFSIGDNPQRTSTEPLVNTTLATVPRVEIFRLTSFIDTDLKAARFNFEVGDPEMYMAYVTGQPYTPDNTVEELLTLLQESELIEPFKLLAGTDDLAELQRRAEVSGVISGLVRLVALARKK